MPGSAARVFALLNTPEPPDHTPIMFGKAVVLGGSVAGLLAARVLADHADKVVVIERDGLGSITNSRPGVPQGTQVHVLLPAGRVQLDRWFPGFSEQALAEGAATTPRDARRFYLDGRLKVPGSETASLTCSRPFLEGLIRRRTLALPNVTAITGQAAGLQFSEGAVTGARYTTAGDDELESADFVVDAMGRSSRLSQWLEQDGWDRPPMRRMTVNLNYATAFFRRDPDGDAANLVVAARRQTTSVDAGGAVRAAIEGDRWIVMMAAYDENRPGQTAEDFLRRCREELPPEFGKAVGNEMLGEVRTYHQADSRRRDFHALRRIPARLISLGDAVASFNPVYGQGMTSAALHASGLSAYLRSQPVLDTAARDFFALQRVVVDAAWSTSTSADLALPHVNGPYPRGYRLSNWISDQIIDASVTDPEIARRFDDVIGMLAHPSSLATPGTVLRALRANRRAR